MDILLNTTTIPDWSGDALLVFAFQNPEKDKPAVFPDSALLEHDLPWLADAPELEDFHGKAGEILAAYPPKALQSSIKRVLLAGLGKKDKFDLKAMRNASAAAFRQGKSLGCKSLGIALDNIKPLDGEASVFLEELLVGGALGLYTFDQFKNANGDDAPPASPETVAVLAQDKPGPAMEAAVISAKAQIAGVSLTRDLVNMPSNVATPQYMADTAQALAKEYGFKATIMGFEEIKAAGMGAFAGVAQGSHTEAKFIVLETASASQAKPLVLVGKGVTFDSGGISIKPSAKMDEMKGDMAGAASVLGVFKAYGELGLDQPLVGIMPCTDNMPGGSAFKPGDILTSYSGKTIEILNTDAEGRLLLCDGLSYAEQYNPAMVVDIATLTGACVVALGPDVAAVFANDEALAQTIQDIGQSVGDDFWPMPLWDFYFESLKSKVADMKNVGNRMGGAIHAAKFLEQFIPKNAPWAHLDIAGPGWTDKDKGPRTPGGTGSGVRTMLNLARIFQSMDE